jgi:hypothetical protein
MGESKRRKQLLGDKYGKQDAEIEIESPAVEEFTEEFLKWIQENIYSKLPNPDVEMDDQFVVKMFDEMKEDFCSDPRLNEKVKRAFSSYNSGIKTSSPSATTREAQSNTAMGSSE